MGVTVLTQEFTSPVAAARLFKALIIDNKILMPKLLPQFIKSINVIQGDGGNGSIEQVNFTADCDVKYVKHRIEELDQENLVCKYTLIEGDVLGHKLESIAYEVRFESCGSDGGCICKTKSHYYLIGDFSIEEDDIKAGKEKSMRIVKVVEAYLLENPRVYA